MLIYKKPIYSALLGLSFQDDSFWSILETLVNPPAILRHLFV